jgi:hypothetical protein
MTAPAVAAPMAAINTAPAATSNELRISSLCSCVIARATFSSEVLKASAESTIAMHIAKMDHSVALAPSQAAPATTAKPSARWILKFTWERIAQSAPRIATRNLYGQFARLWLLSSDCRKGLFALLMTGILPVSLRGGHAAATVTTTNNVRSEKATRSQRRLGSGVIGLVAKGFSPLRQGQARRAWPCQRRVSLRTPS